MPMYFEWHRLSFLFFRSNTKISLSEFSSEGNFISFKIHISGLMWISLSEFCFHGTISLLRSHFILSPLMTGSFFVMPPHSPFKFIIPIYVNSHQWIWLRGFSSGQDSYLWSTIISHSESEFGGQFFSFYFATIDDWLSLLPIMIPYVRLQWT